MTRTFVAAHGLAFDPATAVCPLVWRARCMPLAGRVFRRPFTRSLARHHSPSLTRNNTMGKHHDTHAGMASVAVRSCAALTGGAYHPRRPPDTAATLLSNMPSVRGLAFAMPRVFSSCRRPSPAASRASGPGVRATVPRARRCPRPPACRLPRRRAAS